MVGKTHVIGGVALACATATVCPSLAPSSVGVLGTALFMSGVSFGALLPDIDTNSTVSHYPVFNVISFFARFLKIVHHRGVTHSLLMVIFSLLFGVITGAILGVGGFLFGAGMTIGIISHILLDMLNPTGVQLLYPIPAKISLAGITTGRLGDLVIRLVCLAVVFSCLPKIF